MTIEAIIFGIVVLASFAAFILPSLIQRCGQYRDWFKGKFGVVK